MPNVRYLFLLHRDRAKETRCLVIELAVWVLMRDLVFGKSIPSLIKTNNLFEMITK
jgi:hypothetical protein